MGTTIESDWENTRLLEELAAARAEIEDVQLVSQLHYDANLSLRQQLAAEQAKNVKLLDFIARAQVSSGVCCCGEPMDGHPSPMSCGHSPVDMWDHAVRKLLDAPSDTSALGAIVKKAGEVMRELAENACKAYDEKIETMRDNEYQAELAGRQAGAARCASAIRALPDVTLEDL